MKNKLFIGLAAFAAFGVLIWLLRKVWNSKADSLETDAKFARAEQQMKTAVSAAKAELQSSINDLRTKAALAAPASKTA